MVEANAVEASDVAQFAVGEAIDFLNEYIFYSLLAEVEFANKGVSRMEREFVWHFDTSNYEIDLLVVEGSETDVVFDKKLMTSMLVIVLIISIIDDAL